MRDLDNKEEKWDQKHSNVQSVWSYQVKDGGAVGERERKSKSDKAALRALYEAG